MLHLDPGLHGICLESQIVVVKAQIFKSQMGFMCVLGQPEAFGHLRDISRSSKTDVRRSA